MDNGGPSTFLSYLAGPARPLTSNDPYLRIYTCPPSYPSLEEIIIFLCAPASFCRTGYPRGEGPRGFRVSELDPPIASTMLERSHASSVLFLVQSSCSAEPRDGRLSTLGEIDGSQAPFRSSRSDEISRLPSRSAQRGALAETSSEPSAGNSAVI